MSTSMDHINTMKVHINNNINNKPVNCNCEEGVVHKHGLRQGEGADEGKSQKEGKGRPWGKLRFMKKKKSINQITLSLMCKIVMTFSQYGFSHVCAGRRFVPY